MGCWALFGEGRRPAGEFNLFGAGLRGELVVEEDCLLMVFDLLLDFLALRQLVQGRRVCK